MTDSNGNRFVPLKWVVSILLAIVFAAGGLIVNDTRAGVERAHNELQCLHRDKVDKDQYRLDMAEIKVMLKEIRDQVRR